MNVTGGPVSIAPNYFALNGTRVDDFSATDFGNFAASLLWNFTGSTSVQIGGSSQFMGSILGPAVSLTTTASTNGRIYVGGDYHMAGSGSEHHNYPWDAPFECIPGPTPEAPGSVTIAKTLTPGSPFTNLNFTGVLDCRMPLPNPVVFFARWGVTQGQPIEIDGLPVGAQCTISENPSGVRIDNGDGTFSPADLGTLSWATPVVTVDGANTDSFTVAAGTAVQIGLVNTLLGSFSVAKTVTGPAGGYVGSRAFDVDWNCTAPGYVGGVPVTGSTGTIAVTNGQSGVPELGTPAGTAYFPVGTVCTLSETLTQQPGDFSSGDFEWSGSSVTPASVTIGAGNVGVSAVAVTNTFVSTVGGFTVAKALEGAAASLVPKGTVFTVRYSYQGPSGEITGELKVPADGTAVAGPADLPRGTVVHITEVSLPSVSGLTWDTPSIAVNGTTGDRVTIVGGQNATVVVTNTASSVIAATGSSEIDATGPALLMLGLGALVLAASRRRRVRRG